jgi:diaminopimelate epimerase
VLFAGNLEGIHLERDGSLLENHPFFSNRTNVHFVKIIDRHTVQVRIWERGAGATLSCGTGVCAVAVACYLNGKTDREIEVRVPGGILHANYEESGQVYLTGPVAHVFSGEIEV